MTKSGYCIKTLLHNSNTTNHHRLTIYLYIDNEIQHNVNIEKTGAIHEQSGAVPFVMTAGSK